MAQSLDLLACSSLTATYAVTPSGGDGRYRLTGRIQAALVQACVVTLEPVEGRIDEPLDVAFWPEADIPPPPSGEVDLDETFDPVPIVGGRIDVGPAVFECLAGAIDPFPRKGDAALDRSSAGPAGGPADKPENPFATLARIKEKD